jgi:hypothetical protein
MDIDALQNLPSRHLRDDELEWFAFDPSELAGFVRRYAPDEVELPSLIERVRQAAWSCGSYLTFAVTAPGSIETEAIVDNGLEGDAFREYAIAVDKGGRPAGVELLHRPCNQG